MNTAVMNKNDRFDLLSLLPYEENGIVSKQILKGDKGSATVFSIYEGEKMICNSYPHRALLIGLEGNANIAIGKDRTTIGSLESMIIPQDTKYSLQASDNFKMLLVSKI